MKALLKSASDAGTPLTVLQAVEDINQEQRKRFFRKMVRHFGGKVEGKRFAVWGIAFKPNTDDTREAPVFHIIDELLKGKATVAVYDPEAMAGARARYGDRAGPAPLPAGWRTPCRWRRLLAGRARRRRRPPWRC